MAAAFRTSVIVAVRNDSEGILETLDALAAQTIAAEEFEVLVVDDASADDTAAIVDRHPRAALLQQSAAGGAYAARNRGIREAAGGVIAFTDAGCVPRPSWLERGLSRLRHEGAGAILAGQVAMPLLLDSPLAAMVDVIHHLDQRRLVYEDGSAVTANLIVPASAFTRVGGFDERLQRGGDRDWTRTAVASGLRLVYAEEVVVEHEPRSACALLSKSLATGWAASERRRRGARGAPRPYARPDLLVPRHRYDGKLRVRANGARPSRLRWLAVGAAQLALVQFPQAYAALRADLAARNASSSE